jgi:hypothetical protein
MTAFVVDDGAAAFAALEMSAAIAINRSNFGLAIAPPLGLKTVHT